MNEFIAKKPFLHKAKGREWVMFLEENYKNTTKCKHRI